MIFGADVGPLLVHSEFPDTEDQTAEELLDQLQKVRDMIRDEYKTRDTSYLTDNCNTQRSVRNSYEQNTRNMVHGCGAHLFNTVNQHIFNLDTEINGVIFKERIEDMKKVQDKLKNTKLRKGLKDELLKKKAKTEVKLNNPGIVDPSSRLNDLINSKYEQYKQSGHRIGIPAAGKTRHWNNLFDIMGFQLDNQTEIESIQYVYQFI